MSANEMTVETLLRAHAPHAPAPLRSRVLALEPRRATPSRRLALVLAVALLAAIAAAVVDGLVSSSPKKPHTAALFAPTPRVALAPKVSAGGSGAVQGALPAIAAGRLQDYEA